MYISRLHIRNFRYIQDLTISGIGHALILVGRNNTGKTAILDAIRAVFGQYSISAGDFAEDFPNIEIGIELTITDEDLRQLHRAGRVSAYRRFDSWYGDFRKKLSSFKESPDGGGVLSFTFTANRELRLRYDDGSRKNNPAIPRVLPQLYFLDTQRDLDRFESGLLLMQEDTLLGKMRSGCCMFDESRSCNHCFSCIGLINQKKPADLNAFEAARLLDYKLYQLNLDTFSKQVNDCYHRNGGREEILYSMNQNIAQMLSVTTQIREPAAAGTAAMPAPLRSIHQLGKGMRSIYMLSLLEAASLRETAAPAVILVDEPELFLHPQLQKISGDVLYRLAERNQVIFSTHSPNLLANFNRRQIRQIARDDYGRAVVYPHTDISRILDDLGYSAGDFMNVDFVFIVEGRQDKNRLPLLLRKYYSEIYDENGRLSRISIITTNSCTNIRTYANLKYMNQLYLRDNFLMIRDGDGKDHNQLVRSLCRYYEERGKEDVDHLPRVLPRNVLVLKYYSFENYFLNPDVMAQVGVIEKPDDFYRIFLEKWHEYLYRLQSGRQLAQVLHPEKAPSASGDPDLFRTEDDVRAHMEDIRIHLRGHNLYDLFYGRVKKHETEVLSRYIDLAPREDFADILDHIDAFIYFASRKKPC